MFKKKMISVSIMIMLCLCAILLTPSRSEAHLGERVLSSGAQGYDVQQLQKKLDYLGYRVGLIDGIYGQKTRWAVKEFQWHNGLIIDGITGPQTALALTTQTGQPSPARNTSTPSRASANYSNQDIEDLAKLVHGEARGEPFEGQVAVAAVVLNRVHSTNFGHSIREVIFEPGAFTAVNDGQFNMEPNSSSYQAVHAALDGWDPTQESLYYWNPVTATNKWIWSRPIVTSIGRHVFAR